ncbi:MAG: hypothetical protein CM15mP21_0860 [Hyphomicrobiales bacterium]|nr:MAG: hypothetical protein CM15mP21_0860 [Hyphomicrobiales bacterium]
MKTGPCLRHWLPPVLRPARSLSPKTFPGRFRKNHCIHRHAGNRLARGSKGARRNAGRAGGGFSIGEDGYCCRRSGGRFKAKKAEELGLTILDEQAWLELAEKS